MAKKKARKRNSNAGPMPTRNQSVKSLPVEPAEEPKQVEEIKEEPKQIRIVNRIRKHNTFVGDAVRDSRDRDFLNAEIAPNGIGKREYKGKIKRITTIKECDVSDDGYWVTTFIIDLK